MSTEEERLYARYQRAIGEALALGICTFLPGTGRPGDLGPWMKSLGQLEDEVREAQGKPKAFEHYLADAIGAATERGTR